MLPLIQAKSAEIESLCRALSVRRLDLFGSAAKGGFDPASSDLDFLVELEPVEPAIYADTYFALKEGLEALFGRSVDLVTFASLTNPHFRAAVLKSREGLYGA